MSIEGRVLSALIKKQWEDALAIAEEEKARYGPMPKAGIESVCKRFRDRLKQLTEQG